MGCRPDRALKQTLTLRRDVFASTDMTAYPPQPVEGHFAKTATIYLRPRRTRSILAKRNVNTLSIPAPYLETH